MFAIFENLWWDYWLREAEKGVQNTKTTRKKGNVTWTCFPHIPQRFPPPRQSWASTLPWWRLHLLLRDILQMTEKLISFLSKIGVLPKDFLTNRPNRQIYYCMLPTYFFIAKILLYFVNICILPISRQLVSHRYCYENSEKDDHRPAIRTTIAAATAMAAAAAVVASAAATGATNVTAVTATTNAAAADVTVSAAITLCIFVDCCSSPVPLFLSSLHAPSVAPPVGC